MQRHAATERSWEANVSSSLGLNLALARVGWDAEKYQRNAHGWV